MATTTTERIARAQFDRGTTDTNASREKPTVRTVAFLFLGVALLLVVTTVIATIRVSYHPYRGC